MESGSSKELTEKHISPFLEESLEKIAYEHAYNNNNKEVKTAFIYRKDTPLQNANKILGLHTDYFKEFTDRIISSIMLNGKLDVEKFFDIELSILASKEDILPFVKDNIKSIITQVDLKISASQEITKEKIIKIVQDALEESNLLTSIKQVVSEKSYGDYLGMEYKTLEEGGMSYKPPNDVHKWSHNAAWLLGQFHKGTDTFIIKNKINDRNSLRGSESEKRGEFGSGFFREIAICSKLSYACKLEEKSNQIIMYNSNVEPLKSLTFEDIEKITVEDMKEYYNKVKERYEVIFEELNDKITAEVTKARKEAVTERRESSKTDGPMWVEFKKKEEKKKQLQEFNKKEEGWEEKEDVHPT